MLSIRGKSTEIADNCVVDIGRTMPIQELCVQKNLIVDLL